MNTKKSIEYWGIPPEADEEFAAHMEDVLDVYSRPYDAAIPVLCMEASAAADRPGRMKAARGSNEDGSW